MRKGDKQKNCEIRRVINQIAEKGGVVYSLHVSDEQKKNTQAKAGLNEKSKSNSKLLRKALLLIRKRQGCNENKH